MFTRRGAALIVLAISSLAAAASPPAGRVQPQTGRVQPPPDLACPRDHLTLYAGRVLHYKRGPGRTTIRIATDWQTTETVTLAHPKSDDPSPWFLIDRQAFTSTDWPRIEKRTGHLRPGLRVSAWVCDDGRNATVDWAPPRAP